jgi:hypothetical protein
VRNRLAFALGQQQEWRRCPYRVIDEPLKDFLLLVLELVTTGSNRSLEGKGQVHFSKAAIPSLQFADGVPTSGSRS